MRRFSITAQEWEDVEFYFLLQFALPSRITIDYHVKAIWKLEIDRLQGNLEIKKSNLEIHVAVEE